MPEMGISSNPKHPSGLADALFTRTQQRVLGLLFGQPERTFYANELINLAGAGSGAVQRELVRLVDSGLVTVKPVGNQKHYQANPASPIYAELCGMVRKTVGLVDVLREALAPLAGQVEQAFVYGSMARGSEHAHSDVDLMVIGEVDFAEVVLALASAQNLLQREINPTVLSLADFARELKQKDGFVAQVWSGPKLWVLGQA